jgi:tetratricopeptide (TPR) repeat protein
MCATNYHFLSQALMRAGREDQAIEKARQALSLLPDYFDHFNLAEVLAHFGRWDEASVYSGLACEMARRQRPCAQHALILAHLDRTDEASAAARMAASMSDVSLGVYDVARAFALMGDHQESLSLLKRALDAGYQSAEIITEPDFATLHDNPEFEAIVGEVKQRVGQE